jgi:polar amino acid transport system substrate-binding protein
LIVRAVDAGPFTSYRDLGVNSNARLGVVVGQVQGAAARQAGVPDERLVSFATQDDAVQAVRRGEIDAAASTPIGNRALLTRMDDPHLAASDPPGPAEEPDPRDPAPEPWRPAADLFGHEGRRWLAGADLTDLLV